MQLFELDSTKPILYVDLDGVLADFFTPFNKMAGVTDWKDADKETLQKTLSQIAQTEDFWPNLKVLPEANRLLSGIKENVAEDLCMSGWEELCANSGISEGEPLPNLMDDVSKASTMQGRT